MPVSSMDIIHIILALTIILFVSHCMGYLFQYYKQPRAIGEILAGILLGPSLLQYFYPNFFSYIFNDPVTKTLLNIIYNLGLLHLMFLMGMQLHTKLKKKDKLTKSAASIAFFGMSIPFAFSYLLLQFIDFHEFIGSANNETAFILCFSIAVGVTSLPVIARILYDLKLFNTSFSKIILAATVFEDIVLYVALTMALGMVKPMQEEGFGLAALLGIEHNINLKIIYHILITIAFFSVSLLIGPLFFRWLDRVKFTLYQRINPLAFLISVMLIMTAIAILLDIAPMFGAFLGGIIAQNFKVEQKETSQAFETYSFAFFIPIYFAIVGIKLDLISSFNFLFFTLFLLSCCFFKLFSVYLGARIAKESPWRAMNFGIAMNARGAMAVVLASLALDNNIINISFFNILVMFALVSTFLAGSWLYFIVHRKFPLY